MYLYYDLKYNVHYSIALELKEREMTNVGSPPG